MPTEIPQDVKDILDEPVFVHLATTNPDGSPQVSVIWIQRDGDLLRFSSVEGRAKPRNLVRDPRAALSFSPLDDPYRNITIKAHSIDMANLGHGLIDQLANKYLGVEAYEWSKEGEVRVDITLAVEKVSG